MNDCDNAIAVINCTDPIHKLLADYLITDEFSETALDFEKIAPIPLYLQDPPSEVSESKAQRRSNDELTEEDVRDAFRYCREHRPRLDALNEWLKAYWGFNSCVENCSVNDMFIEFSTDSLPAKGIVAKLARLTGHVLRLTYLSNSVIGEFVAYPSGDTRTLEFEDLDQAPRWLKDETGYDPE